MVQPAESERARYERGLALLHADRSPPEQARARVLTALEARLGPGLEPGSEPGPGASEPGVPASGGGFAAAHVAKVIAVTVALTSAGVLALRLGALGVAALGAGTAGADDDVGEPELRAPTHVEHERGSPATDGESPGVGEAAPLAVPQPDSRSDQEPAAHPRRSTPSARPKPSVDEFGSADAAADAAAELALIHAARAAKDPSAAIAVLEAHAGRFPAGVLSDERELLWVLAECEQGAHEAAQARAARFVQRRPSSPLIERMASGCPALDIDVTNSGDAGHG